MAGHKEARNLRVQEPGRENRYALAAVTPKQSNANTPCQSIATAISVESWRTAKSVPVPSNGQPGRAKIVIGGLHKELNDSASIHENPNSSKHHETADPYGQVVAQLCDGWRVIACKDNIQWILQRRKKGGAERPWRAVGYCRTRNALIRLCAASCGRIDPGALAALAALPEYFGGAA